MTPKKSTYIDGQWINASGLVRPVLNAATGQPHAVIETATTHDVERAVTAAGKATQLWAAMTPEERGHILGQIADGVAVRAGEIAAAITVEVGMPLKLCERIQVGAPVAAWRNYAKLAAAPTAERKIGDSIIIEEPVGVVAAITPWNYPLHQITAKVAAALAAGCTVVLKPSEVAPLSAILLAEAIHGSDMPPGVFNMVTGVGAEIGPALVEHPDVAMVSFTGSTQTGRKIAAAAAGQMKRFSLELGGKSAAVVLEGADLSAAVKATLASCLLNSGQTCNAMTRLIIPSGWFDETAELIQGFLPRYIVGDPADPATRVGPLSTAAQKRKVDQYISGAISEGVPVIAQAELGKSLSRGFYVAPIVFGPVADGHVLVQEEIFGPVLVVQTHDGPEDAVRLANCTPYGLAASVWAADRKAAEAIGRKIRAGQVDLNGAPFNLFAPFGGYGSSGLGRENGEYGLREFLETKSLQLPPGEEGAAPA